MKMVKLFIEAIFVAYLVIFAINNQQVVDIKFFFDTPSYSLPFFLLVIIALFIGFFIGVLMMFVDRFSVSSELHKTKKELEEAQKEINELKNIALTQNSTAPAATKTKAGEEKLNDEIKNILR